MIESELLNKISNLINNNYYDFAVVASKIIFIIISISILCYFIYKEYKIITRKKATVNLYREIDIKKNYDFKLFLEYNWYHILDCILYFLFLIIIGCVFIPWMIIPIVIMLILLFIGLLVILKYWLLLPIVIFILKYLLYKISERYKK